MTLKHTLSGMIGGLLFLSAGCLLLAGCSDKSVGVNLNTVQFSSHIPAPIPATADAVASSSLKPSNPAYPPVLIMPQLAIATDSGGTLTASSATGSPSLTMQLADGSAANLSLRAQGDTVFMDHSVALPVGNASITLEADNASVLSAAGAATSHSSALGITGINMFFTVQQANKAVNATYNWTLPASYVLNMTQVGTGLYQLADSTLTVYWDGTTSVPPVAPGQTIYGRVDLYDASNNKLETCIQYPVVTPDGKSATFYGHSKTHFAKIVMTLDVAKH